MSGTENPILDEPERWENLTITNRFMFNKVFTTNIGACKRLIEILLGLKISEIKPPQGEYVIEGNVENHAVRFDVYTEDESRIYDIEMQTTYEDDLPERARYYQSMMDIDTLPSGRPYKDLKTSVVVFICTFDPFGKGRPKYIFRNIDTEDRETELNDRTSKVFFNAQSYDKIKGDAELRGLLKFFSESKAETSFASNLERLVGIARKNERWRQNYMEYERWKYYTEQEGMRKGITKGIQQGISQGISQQKAEDEKLIAQITAQKNAEIARLKALLAAK